MRTTVTTLAQTFPQAATNSHQRPIAASCDAVVGGDPIAELERLGAEIKRDTRFFGLLFLITAVGIAAGAVAGVWQ